ncbi:MAG: hypothetical protein R3185_01055 [Candidatus Thermoplasmatota archaeon]|nr:hypothetical protein [Candidatus Thermoplasmatota archaeon]
MTPAPRVQASDPPTSWIKTLILAGLLLVVGLAGCLGTTEDPTEGAAKGEDAGAQAPSALTFTGCWEVLGTWELSYEEVAPYIPPGFENTALFPAEDTHGFNATMDVIAITCPDPWDATIFLPRLYAFPPDHLVDPEADAFMIAPTCIATPALAEALSAWDVPCLSADGGIERLEQTPGAATWAFEASLPDLSVRLEGTGLASNLLSPEPVFQMFHVMDREVCAMMLMELEDHIHWNGGPFTLEVEGELEMPVPEEPSQGLLATPAFDMVLRPSTVPLDPLSDESRCPAA